MMIVYASKNMKDCKKTPEEMAQILDKMRKKLSVRKQTRYKL